MTLSHELQQGKAAEHLVCADLILQGHSAFLADQGKGGRRLASNIDLFAFVALATRQIAYLPLAWVSRNGIPIQLVEFRPPEEIATRLYTNGTVRAYPDIRYIHRFPFASAIKRAA
jgi:hypothetical protein